MVGSWFHECRSELVLGIEFQITNHDMRSDYMETRIRTVHDPRMYTWN